MTARQSIASGFPSPLFVNETVLTQAITGGAFMLDQTAPFPVTLSLTVGGEALSSSKTLLSAQGETIANLARNFASALETVAMALQMAIAASESISNLLVVRTINAEALGITPRLYRQALLPGFVSPVFMNEAGTTDSITTGGVFLDETAFPTTFIRLQLITDSEIVPSVRRQATASAEISLAGIAVSGIGSLETIGNLISTRLIQTELLPSVTSSLTSAVIEALASVSTTLSQFDDSFDISFLISSGPNGQLEIRITLTPGVCTVQDAAVWAVTIKDI